MSFHSWLPNLRSTIAPNRGRERHGRRGPRRSATHRPSLEFLEERRVPAFLAPVNYTVGGTLLDVVAANFNNDTVPDLAVVNFDNSTVGVLLGNGDGTFQAARNSATGTYPHSLAVGDFDGDGNLDLATANSLDVSVLLGDGAGRFTPASGSGFYVSGSPESVAVGDFNGDGLLDLGVNTCYDGLVQFQSADVLLGNGDGSFSWGYSAYLGDGGPGDFAAIAADLNGDGFDDFVTATAGAYAHVLLSNSSGGLQRQSSYYIGDFYLDSYPSVPVVAADLDADGDTDLIVMGRVLQGDGTGGFTVGSFGADSYGAVVLGDFTADGNLDVAQATWGSVGIRHGRGNGTFSAPESFAANSGPYGAATADFNGDGWLDVVTVYSGGGSVLINDRSWPPPPPSLTINDAKVTEGNIGTINATFTVTLSHASGVDVTVHYATADGTAVAGSDYTAKSGVVTIPAGQTSAPVTIAVKGDRLGEADETFFVNLSSATNATIADGQGVGTVLDDEPRISINSVSITEGKSGTKAMTFTVTLSAAYDQPVTVKFATHDDTAKASDNDYVATSGTLTFGPGETSKTITVLIKGDTRKEADESFYVLLSDASSNALIESSMGWGTILNDDGGKGKGKG